MVVFLQNNSIWNKLENNEYLKYEDIEGHIYSKEYLESASPVDFINSNIDKIYNPNLYQYFFEVEDYDNEELYEEVFFQKYIDGEIDWNYYVKHEKIFIDLMESLFDTGDVYVFCHLFVDLKDNYPLKKCTDITINTEIISENSNKIIKIDDRNIFRQISVLSAREVLSVDFIFAGIQSVLVNSGMHGYLLSEEVLESTFTQKIQKHMGQFLRVR